MGFDLNSFCDNLDDGYGIFDDVADSLNFAAVGIDTSTPVETPSAPVQKKSESNKKNNSKNKGLVKQSLVGTKKRGKKPGQRGKCSQCGALDHNKRTCTFFKNQFEPPRI